MNLQCVYSEFGERLSATLLQVYKVKSIVSIELISKIH